MDFPRRQWTLPRRHWVLDSTPSGRGEICPREGTGPWKEGHLPLLSHHPLRLPNTRRPSRLSGVPLCGVRVEVGGWAPCRRTDNSDGSSGGVLPRRGRPFGTVGVLVVGRVIRRNLGAAPPPGIRRKVHSLLQGCVAQRVLWRPDSTSDFSRATQMRRHTQVGRGGVRVLPKSPT